MSAPGEPTTIRERLEAIDRLSDPLPKTAYDAYDRLCLICEEVEAALAILEAAEVWQDGSWLNPDPPMSYRVVPDPVRLVGRVEPHDDNGDTT